MTKLIVSLLLLMNLNVTASDDVQLLCEDEYSEMVFDLVLEKTPGCMADLVWGKSNICFEGDAEDLAYMMNSGYFDNASSGYRIAKANVTRDGVSYLGIDAQSFWQSRRLVKACEN
jgi:hypothetical protein